MFIMPVMFVFITMLVPMLVSVLVSVLISVKRYTINTLKVIDSKSYITPICNFGYTEFSCFYSKIRIVYVT